MTQEQYKKAVGLNERIEKLEAVQICGMLTDVQYMGMNIWKYFRKGQ